MVAKRVKMPTSISLGSYTYSVTAVDADTLRKVGDIPADQIPYGAYSSDDQAIFINGTTTEQTKAATLAHELVHAIMFTNNLEANEDTEKNEELVDGIALGLVELIKRNPDVMAYIAGAQ